MEIRAALIEQPGEDFHLETLTLDGPKEDEVLEMTAKIRDSFGPVDILVNNAGIIKRIPMHEMTAEEFRQVVDIDLTAAFIVSKAVLPDMMENPAFVMKSLTHDKIREEYNSIKLALFIMIFCPLSEEIIFRYFIFKHINEASINSIWVFYLISTLAFIFDHFVTQQIKSLYKVPLSLIECWTYAIWRNTFLCVVIHMCYNICVYAHNSSKYKRYY